MDLFSHHNCPTIRIHVHVFTRITTEDNILIQCNFHALVVDVSYRWLCCGWLSFEVKISSVNIFGTYLSAIFQMYQNEKFVLLYLIISLSYFVLKCLIHFCLSFSHAYIPTTNVSCVNGCFVEEIHFVGFLKY